MNFRGIFQTISRLSNSPSVLWKKGQHFTSQGSFSIQRNILSTSDDWNHTILKRKLLGKFELPFRSINTDGLDLDKIKYEFSLAFKEICSDVPVKEDAILTFISKRLEKVIEYNVFGGKLVRGTTVVSAFKALSKNTSEENIKLAYILGACVELVHCTLLLFDDIMDNSIMRRGKLCWFRHPGVGFEAIDDALMLDYSVNDLLKKYFANKSCFWAITDTFQELRKCTIWGQSLDGNTYFHGKDLKSSQLDKFTIDHYRGIAHYKTSMYTFCCPFDLAMHLDGTFTHKDFKAVKEIGWKLGELYQMQDDYLDLYGNYEAIGNSTTDVTEGKCTWFVVTALQIGSEDDKKVLKENYGVDTADAVEKIYKLFASLSLKEKYNEEERKLHSNVMTLICALDDNVFKKDFFISLLKMIHKRKK